MAKKRKVKVDKDKQKARITIILLVLMYAAFFVIGVKLQVTPEKIRNFILGFGTLGPIVFALTYWLFITIPSLPNPPLMLGAGMIFGIKKGFLISYIVSCIAYATNFLLARKYGRGLVATLIGKKGMQELDKVSETIGRKGVFFLRLVPGFSFDVLAYAVGLSSMQLKRFVQAYLVPQAIIIYIVIVVGDLSVENPAYFFALLGLSLAGFIASTIYGVLKAKKASRKNKTLN